MSFDVDAIRRAPAFRDPHGVARLLGLQVAKGTSARSRVVRVLCPWHSDRSPSCDLTLRDGSVVGYCRSCSQGGDVLSLIAAVEGLDPRRDFRAVVTRAAELAGVEIQDDRRPAQPRPPPRDPLQVAREELREARREASSLRRQVAELQALLEDVAAERIIEWGLRRALYQGACDVIAELQARLARVPQQHDRSQLDGCSVVQSREPRSVCTADGALAGLGRPSS